MDQFTFITYSKVQVRSSVRALFALLGSSVRLILRPDAIRLLLAFFLLPGKAWPTLTGPKPGTLSPIRSYMEVTGLGKSKQKPMAMPTSFTTHPMNAQLHNHRHDQCLGLFG